MISDCDFSLCASRSQSLIHGAIAKARAHVSGMFGGHQGRSDRAHGLQRPESIIQVRDCEASTKRQGNLVRERTGALPRAGDAFRLFRIQCCYSLLVRSRTNYISVSPGNKIRVITSLLWRRSTRTSSLSPYPHCWSDGSAPLKPLGKRAPYGGISGSQRPSRRTAEPVAQCLMHPDADILEAGCWSLVDHSHEHGH